ncbi:MAG: glycosyltransferase [Prevotellaceae bacterium]|jgi:glycosyltransferase involved in cell wall biosynthesis|nr:glycosyltransferase [Prevotellaceae bacterium]
MKISVITVCYNSEKYIRTAIESVLNQTCQDIEYIIVDGNSTDSTINIVKEYEPEFNGSMRYISEADSGLYEAMNKGIKMATGEIIGILNSDDFYNYSDCLEKIAAVFEDKNIDACFADVRFVKQKNTEKTVRYYSSAKFSPALFRWGFMPAHPSFFARKKCFEKAGYYKTDYKIAADYELLIRFLYTERFSYKYIPLDIIKMRTGGKSTKSLKSNCILNKEIVRGCRENGIYTNIFLLCFKYFWKIFEFIFLRKKHYTQECNKTSDLDLKKR